jgi:hypothetical protein
MNLNLIFEFDVAACRDQLHKQMQVVDIEEQFGGAINLVAPNRYYIRHGNLLKVRHQHIKTAQTTHAEAALQQKVEVSPEKVG